MLFGNAENFPELSYCHTNVNDSCQLVEVPIRT